MRVVALPVALALAFPVGALAQQPQLGPGQRVRVTVPNVETTSQEGTFERVAGDTLVLSAASYSLADVTRLEVHRGRGVNSTRLIAMSVGGAALGAGIGWGIGKAVDASCNEGLCLDLAQGWGLGVGAAIGFVAGLTAGALLKSDRWEEVPVETLRVSIAPQRDGVGMGVHLRF